MSLSCGCVACETCIKIEEVEGDCVLCMTWAGRHELNVGCLNARGGYKYLRGTIGRGHG